MPEAFKGWVNPGGRLFVISGTAPAMEACLYTRLNVSEWRRESLFETDVPALINAGEAAVVRILNTGMWSTNYAKAFDHQPGNTAAPP